MVCVVELSTMTSGQQSQDAMFTHFQEIFPSLDPQVLPRSWSCGCLVPRSFVRRPTVLQTEVHFLGRASTPQPLWVRCVIRATPADNMERHAVHGQRIESR